MKIKKLILVSLFFVFTFTLISQNLQKHTSFIQTNCTSFLFPQKRSKAAQSDFLFTFSTTDPSYDSIYVYEIDSVKKWQVTYKDVDILYNSNKNVISLTRKERHNKTWKNFRKYSYTYDADYNKTNSLVQAWDGMNWINLIQQTATFAAGKEEINIEQQWNSSSNSWYNIGKIVNTYDTADNLSIEEFQLWSNNTWKLTQRHVNSYTADNRKKEQLLQSYDNVSSWRDSYRVLFQYDTQGNNIVIDAQGIDENNNWRNNIRIQSGFDNNNNLAIEKAFLWDIDHSVWDEFSTSLDYLWDLNRNLLAYKTKEYVGGIYLLSQSYNATYNSLNQLTDKGFIGWNKSDTTIYDGDSTHYYIQESPGNIKKTSIGKNSIFVYPNPSNGTFTVTTESKHRIKILEVYSIIGELIFQQHLSNQVSIPNATAGIYFVKVNDGTGIYTRKIIIQ